MKPTLNTELRRQFGFESFRAGQETAIRHVLNQKDTLVVMPTGAGKSVCYQLPALLSEGTTLVVSPLIALMKDQVAFLKSKSKRATYINSSLTTNEQVRRLQAMLDGRYSLVYVAPERFRSSAFLDAASRITVGLFVIDEAHCISQWGHDFRPDYLSLRAAKGRLGNPSVMALTATATVKVQDDIVRQLHLENCEKVITGFNRPNLSFEVQYSADDPAKFRSLQQLVTGNRSSCIIYVSTRRQAEEVADFVRTVCRRKTDYYHAGLDAAERSRGQESFMADETSIIVATNAFGMGVDKPNIRQVIHFNLPATLEAYYQEAGRAGRDGDFSRCILLYAPQDRSLQEWFIENDAPNRDEFEDLYEIIFGLREEDFVRLSFSYLKNRTGLFDTKIRLGLAELVKDGWLTALGDESGIMNYRVRHQGSFDPSRIVQRIADRRRYKYAQLQQMVVYAEGNHCRRRFILKHFGDVSSAEAEICCDVCASQKELAAKQSSDNHTYSESEKAALIILHAVKHLKRKAGRARLAEVLAGSRSKNVLAYNWHTTKPYGRLQQFSQADCSDMMDQLLKTGYLKLIGSDFPVLRLTPKGEQALRQRATIALKTTRLRETPAPVASALRKIGTLSATHQSTLQLFRQGLEAAQIAERRGLTLATIFEHFAVLISADVVKLTAVVPVSKVQAIRRLLKHRGVSSLNEVKAALPEDCTYEEIRCVMAESERTTSEKRQPVPSEPRAEDVNLFERLREFRLRLSKQANMPPFVFFHDSVLRDLAAWKPRSLAELGRIKGLGPAKISKYGDELVKIVNAQNCP